MPYNLYMSILQSVWKTKTKNWNIKLESTDFESAQCWLMCIVNRIWILYEYLIQLESIITQEWSNQKCKLLNIFEIIERLTMC